jgi:hypothetical protein
MPLLFDDFTAINDPTTTTTTSSGSNSILRSIVTVRNRPILLLGLAEILGDIISVLFVGDDEEDVINVVRSVIVLFTGFQFVR